jgi:transcriptional regulator with XRE-family HTH domain
MSDEKKTRINLYIIDRVKEIRLKNNMSQSILATKLDVSDAFIGAIENPNHRAKYNIDHLNKLGKIFNCSPKDFLPENPIE